MRHKEIKKNLVAFLCGELKKDEEEHFASHLNTCSHCQRELEQFKKIMEGANSLPEDIVQAIESVDWEALPAQISEAVFQAEAPRLHKPWWERLRLFVPQLKPAYAAGVLVGILLGSLVTFLIFRGPFLKQAREEGLFASQDFLERVELEMARRETLDYLDKSQYLLLDFVQSPPEKLRSGEVLLASEQVSDLLSKKKYLNPQLDKFRMAKAKQILDQIEFLFMELAQISDKLSDSQLRELQNLIEEKQLLLKIKLLKKELEESEV